MPMRVKCRCGQELVLRYGDWVYLLLGLLVLCLVVNTLVLVLLYLRLEEGGVSVARPPTGLFRPAAEEGALAPGSASSRKLESGADSTSNSQGSRTDDEGEPSSGESADADETVRPGAGDPPPAAVTPNAAAVDLQEGSGARPAYVLSTISDSALSTPEAVVARLSGSGDKRVPGERAQGDGLTAPGRALQAHEHVRALVDAPRLARLFMLEAAPATADWRHAFFLDPDSLVRRRAFFKLSTARSPESGPALAGFLGRALPLFQLDGMEREYREFCQLRSPDALKPGVAESSPHAGLWSNWQKQAGQALSDLRASRLKSLLNVATRQGIDIAFVVDASRSMETALGEVQAVSRWLFPALQWSFPTLRMALLLYDDEVRAYHAFTGEPEELLTDISRAKAQGGGDVPEGVHVAVREALSLGRLQWREGARKEVFVIGDAPPPYDEAERLKLLLRQATAQGDYRFHFIGLEPQEGRTEVPLFAQLAQAGGGCSVTPSGRLGDDFLKCLLGPEVDVAAALIPGLEWLFEARRQ